jgi:secondary thiamine-phosphate synthase enzyme
MCDVKVFNEKFVFSTKGEIDFMDLTGKVHEIVRKSGIKNGLIHVFAPHATGVLILTEHEPSLDRDIKDLLEKIVPKHGGYRHPSNAHSHLRSMLLPPDRTLPIIDGEAVFGTWQSLVFVETDVYPRRRTIIMQAIGE